MGQSKEETDGKQTKVQLEKTAKKWKVVQMMSALSGITSLFALLVNPAVGILCLIFAFILAGIAKFGVWWDHG